MYIETSLTEAINKKDEEKNSPSLDLTGQLGDVMKESAKISYTFSKVCSIQLLSYGTVYIKLNLALCILDSSISSKLFSLEVQ